MGYVPASQHESKVARTKVARTSGARAEAPHPLPSIHHPTPKSSSAHGLKNRIAEEKQSLRLLAWDKRATIRVTLLAIALITSLMPFAAHAQDSTPASLPGEYGQVLFEPHIREILSAHCVECHGIKQSKGGFRVDERDTLLGYITPGDVKASSLWTDYLVTKDEELHMPPLKNGNPLSQFELAAIRVWIEDGAVWPEGLAWSTGQGGEPVAEPPKVPPSEKNVVQKAMTFTGFFHPAIVHFPIGLLLVSGFFAIMAFLKRDAFEAAAFHCLWIGALGAIASCIAGWAYADLQGYPISHQAVMRHRICGIAVAVIAVALTPIALAARRSKTSSWRYVWAGGALCLALLVSIAGHQGGELTYGEDLVGRAYERAFGK